MKSYILLAGMLVLAGGGCAPVVDETIEDMPENDAVVEEIVAVDMEPAAKEFVLEDGSITYTNEEHGFSFSYPQEWDYTEWDGGSITLDPPGEGPNPYSDETGDGTNPMDDVVVSVAQIDDLVSYLAGDSVTGDAKDAKPLMIDGHKANAYNGIGLVEYFNYVVHLKDNMYVTVSGASDISEDVATVALSLTFEDSVE